VAAEKLDLARPRALGDLVSAAFTLFARHFSLVFTLALIVVAPYGLLVDGVWGGTLAEGPDADPEVGPTATSAAISAFVAGPLVTAMLARVVLALAEGRTMSVGEGLRAGLQVFLPAAVAIALAVLVTVLGFALLILPGIFLGVLLAFAGQAVVVDGCRGVAALRRSAELVRGDWWSTFGRLIVINLVAFVITIIPGAFAAAIENGAIHTTLVIIGNAMGIAFSAVATTLLFFDRRARKEPVPA